MKLLRSRRDDAFGLLRSELHHYLTEIVRPSGWYPESDHTELLRAGARLYPGSPDRALEMMGEFAARTHCEIYKEILVGRGSPSRTFAMWATQHDTGELRRVRELPNRMRFELIGFGQHDTGSMSLFLKSPTSAYVELRDFEDRTRDFCRVTTGYVREGLCMNDFSDVAITEVACSLDGADCCAWRASWKRGG